jgi:hypothetical protein
MQTNAWLKRSRLEPESNGFNRAQACHVLRAFILSLATNREESWAPFPEPREMCHTGSYNDSHQ